MLGDEKTKYKIMKNKHDMMKNKGNDDKCEK